MLLDGALKGPDSGRYLLRDHRQLRPLKVYVAKVSPWRALAKASNLRDDQEFLGSRFDLEVGLRDSFDFDVRNGSRVWRLYLRSGRGRQYWRQLDYRGGVLAARPSCSLSRLRQ